MNASFDANSRYLDARVMTASQPELQLILLDGALRFGRQAQQIWDDAELRQQCEHLTSRLLDVVDSLIQGVASGSTEFSKRLEEEYAFAFRQIAMAQLQHDSTPLIASLGLLEIERETWRLACERLKAEAAKTPAPIAPHVSLISDSPSLSLHG